MFIYCYEDMYEWGKMLFEASLKRGVEAKIFNKDDQVKDEKDSFAFIHLQHFPFTRTMYDKQVAAGINSKKNVKLIPTITECLMYDNKWQFYDKFSQYTPKTYLITNENKANDILTFQSFPFVSKSREGAASSNVRLISNLDQAKTEISLAFNAGIDQFAGEKQKGYLIWQELCPNNPNDWRVIVIAQKYFFVLKRFNRDNVPFASGSGRFEPIHKLDEELIMLMNLARRFVSENSFSFTGVDIVYDKEKKPVILEMTTGWDLNVYKGCMIYKYENGEYIPTGLDAKQQMFDMMVQAMIDKEF